MYSEKREKVLKSIKFNAPFLVDQDVTKIELSNQKLTSTEVISLCDALRYNKSVQVINLADNAIDDECLSELLTVISQNPVKELYLQNNILTIQALFTLDQIFKKPNQLETLFLHGNNFNDPCGCQLPELIFNPSNEHFHLRYLRLGPKLDLQLLKKLESSKQSMPTITVLNLGKSFWEYEKSLRDDNNNLTLSFEHLATSFPSLTKLRLSHINSNDVLHLLSQLSFKNLRELDLKKLHVADVDFIFSNWVRTLRKQISSSIVNTLHISLAINKRDFDRVLDQLSVLKELVVDSHIFDFDVKFYHPDEILPWWVLPKANFGGFLYRYLLPVIDHYSRVDYAFFSQYLWKHLQNNFVKAFRGLCDPQAIMMMMCQSVDLVELDVAKYREMLERFKLHYPQYELKVERWANDMIDQCIALNQLVRLEKLDELAKFVESSPSKVTVVDHSLIGLILNSHANLKEADATIFWQKKDKLSCFVDFLDQIKPHIRFEEWYYARAMALDAQLTLLGTSLPLLGAHVVCDSDSQQQRIKMHWQQCPQFHRTTLENPNDPLPQLIVAWQNEKKAIFDMPEVAPTEPQRNDRSRLVLSNMAGLSFFNSEDFETCDEPDTKADTCTRESEDELVNDYSGSSLSQLLFGFRW